MTDYVRVGTFSMRAQAASPGVVSLQLRSGVFPFPAASVPSADAQRAALQLLREAARSQGRDLVEWWLSDGMALAASDGG